VRVSRVLIGTRVAEGDGAKGGLVLVVLVLRQARHCGRSTLAILKLRECKAVRRAALAHHLAYDTDLLHAATPQQSVTKNELQQCDPYQLEERSVTMTFGFTSTTGSTALDLLRWAGGTHRQDRNGRLTLKPPKGRKMCASSRFLMSVGRLSTYRVATSSEPEWGALEGSCCWLLDCSAMCTVLIAGCCGWDCVRDWDWGRDSCAGGRDASVRCAGGCSKCGAMAEGTAILICTCCGAKPISLGGVVMPEAWTGCTDVPWLIGAGSAAASEPRGIAGKNACIDPLGI
jgi:hypothetical protein